MSEGGCKNSQGNSFEVIAKRLREDQDFAVLLEAVKIDEGLAREMPQLTTLTKYGHKPIPLGHIAIQGDLRQ